MKLILMAHNIRVKTQGKIIPKGPKKIRPL